VQSASVLRMEDKAVGQSYGYMVYRFAVSRTGGTDDLKLAGGVNKTRSDR
jgi:hypothetical protein